MLKENALRKKLSDLGISASGPRLLLEKRHKEWITIWNANCDAAKPKKRHQLLHDLEVWERTQGGRAPAAARLGGNAVMVKDKEFDGKAWASTHDESFKDLIERARRSRAKPITTNGTGGENKTDHLGRRNKEGFHSHEIQEIPSSSQPDAEDGMGMEVHTEPYKAQDSTTVNAGTPG
jgi:E3 ubiquitin-protein ligase RAD18